MKYNRPAVVAGLAAGILAAGGSIAYPCSVYLGCRGSTLASNGGFTWAPTAIGALGILLILDSVFSLVGPRRTFYGITVVSMLLAVLLVGVSSELNGLFLWPTVVLALAASALSTMVARSKSGFTEQSNPMNLPVFG